MFSPVHRFDAKHIGVLLAVQGVALLIFQVGGSTCASASHLHMPTWEHAVLAVSADGFEAGSNHRLHHRHNRISAVRRRRLLEAHCVNDSCWRRYFFFLPITSYLYDVVSTNGLWVVLVRVIVEGCFDMAIFCRLP